MGTQSSCAWFSFASEIQGQLLAQTRLFDGEISSRAGFFFTVSVSFTRFKLTNLTNLLLEWYG